MRKVWTVAILGRSSDGRESGSCGGAVSPEVFLRGLERVKQRVEGDLALACVARTIAEAELIEGAVSAGYAVQVILPQEIEAATNNLPPGDRAAWKTAVEKAGINILPGRGATPEDWADCAVWLREAADIELQMVAEDAGSPGGDSREGPVVRLHPVTGDLSFLNFPVDGPLRDEELPKLSRRIFGRGRAPENLSEMKARTSAIAGRWAPVFRMLETGTLLLNLAPSMVLAFGALLMWAPTTKTIWKFGFALSAVVMALLVKRLAIQKRWIHARAAAELCRSLLASSPILGPLFPVAVRFLPDYVPLARSLALGHAVFPRLTRDSAIELRDHYVQERLDKQIAYYKAHSRRARRFQRRVKRIFSISLTLSVISTAMALAYHLGYLGAIPTAVHERIISGFATFAFPALAAASLGILGLHECTRRAEFFAGLCDRLRERRRLLLQLRSASSIREAVRDIEEILTEEVAEWMRRRVF